MESPPNAVSVTPQSTNIVAVPVIHQQDCIYAYICIRGILSGDDCAVFGLSNEETAAIQKRFAISSIEICHGVMIKSNVFQVMNSLSKLGYKVVCSSGEKETTWTMQRDI